MSRIFGSTLALMLVGAATAVANNKPLPQADDLRVLGLGDVEHYEAFAEFDGDMYAGTLPSDNGNRTGEMMFWLFEPEHQAVEDSMIL